MDNECNCSSCQEACENKPGWFAPGEAEKAADHLGLSLSEFFARYLAVDYWGADDLFPDTFLLSPATKTIEPGKMFPFDPRGQCVFFQDGKCEIHAVKPNECRFAHHDLTHEEHTAERHKIVKAWLDEQDQIESLLGGKPEIPMPSMSDILSLFSPGL